MNAATIGLIATVLATFTIAAVLDFRARRVPNVLWVLALLVGTPFLVWSWIMDPSAILVHLVSAAAVTVASVLLFIGKAFGGADAKGVMVLGLLWPPILFDPSAAMIHPALDAVIPALIVGHVALRWTRLQSFPFYLALTPITMVWLAIGGVLWWPFVWFSQWISSQITST